MIGQAFRHVVLKTIEGDFNLSMIHLTAATSGSI
jgi:hypothetical protein